MVLKYIVSPYPSLLENMVAKVYEASDDTAEVDSIVLPTPHTAPVTVTFNGLDKVVHVVRLFTASGTKLHEYNAEPVTDLVTIFDPLRFKVGDGGFFTPAANQGRYDNPALHGLTDNDYFVFRNNYGMLFPQVHYTPITDPLQVGGFDLAAPDVFNDGEEFTIVRSSKVAQVSVNDSVVGKWYKGFIDIFASRSYLPDDLRKIIRLNGAVTYEFIGSIPINYGFVIQNFSATDGIGKVKFSNAGLQLGDNVVTEISLPRYTSVGLTYNGTNWDVTFLCDSRWILGTGSAYVKGDIVDCGIQHIGDVGAGDPVFTIVHNKAIVGDYGVQLSIRATQASKNFDNDVIVVWYHDPNPLNKPNQFLISMQERAAGAQNMDVFWTIIKL